MTGVLIDSTVTDYLRKFRLKGEPGREVYVVAEMEGIKLVKTDVFNITGNINLFDFRPSIAISSEGLKDLLEFLEKEVEASKRREALLESEKAVFAEKLRRSPRILRKRRRSE